MTAADTLTLDGAQLISVSNGPSSGITINARDAVVMTNGSLVLAGSLASSTGGNIVISTDRLLAELGGNNDILALNGGRVFTNINQIQGFLPSGVLDGITGLNQLRGNTTNDIGPTIALPERSEFSDNDNLLRFTDREPETLPALQIAAGCGDGSFVITGRGGLPPSSNTPFFATPEGVPWVTAAIADSPSAETVARAEPEPALVEAQGIALDPDGQPYLVAATDQAAAFYHTGVPATVRCAAEQR